MLEYRRSMRASVFVLILILSVIALTIPLASGRKSKSSQVTMAMRAFRVPFGQKIWVILTNTV